MKTNKNKVLEKGDKSHSARSTESSEEKLASRHKETKSPILIFFKEHPKISLFVCFFGIIGTYSYYAYLQEYL